MINPVRIASKVYHPMADGPSATLEARKLKELGLAPILCNLKISSWVPQGKLDKIVIKHEFKITLIQGQISIKDKFASMDFGGAESEANITDINDEQEKMLKQ